MRHWLSLAVILALVPASATDARKSPQHEREIRAIETSIVDAVTENARLTEEIKTKKLTGFVTGLLPLEGLAASCGDWAVKLSEETKASELVRKYNDGLAFINAQRNKLYHLDSAEWTNFNNGKGVVELEPKPKPKLGIRHCPPPPPKTGPPPRKAGILPGTPLGSLDCQAISRKLDQQILAAERIADNWQRHVAVENIENTTGRQAMDCRRAANGLPFAPACSGPPYGRCQNQWGPSPPTGYDGPTAPLNPSRLDGGTGYSDIAR